MLQNCFRIGRLGPRLVSSKFAAQRASLSASQSEHSAPKPKLSAPIGLFGRSFATSSVHRQQHTPEYESPHQLVESELTPELFVDADQARKLKILQLEVDVLRQEGRRVPAVLKPEQWAQLLSLPTKSARCRYYGFLWTTEKKRENEQARKERRREEMAAKRAERNAEHEQSQHIVYSLSGTSYFLRIYETTMNHWHNNKLMRAMQFGQKLVIDCSYDEHMTKRECILAAKQLMFCFAENRYHDHPFDLHFCNADLTSSTMDYLHRHIPTMLEPAFPMNVHEDSYLEHFPRERLVYLTPHCKNDLVEYDPDDVYIIGAMVDTMHNEPLSLAKAKKQGLRMARLPLDRYLQWGSGSGKSLTINQMAHIMLDLKTTGDWTKALAHVPRRKLVLDEPNAGRNERQKWSQAAQSMRMSNADRRPKSGRLLDVAEMLNDETPAAGKNAGESSVPVNKFRRKKD